MSRGAAEPERVAEFVTVTTRENQAAAGRTLAVQSAWRQPWDSDAAAETMALPRAAVRAPRPDAASW